MVHKEQKFKAGSEVFSEDGQAAEYVARIPEGHVVRPMVEAYYGDEEYTHAGDPVTWRAVFKQPPVAKYSEELKALHVEIAAARKALNESREVERAEERQRAAKFKKTGILKGIEDFIDGKITHYVDHESPYSPPSIIAVADAISGGDNSRYRQSLRLLTLGGDLRDGKLTWILNQYSDGSGNSGRNVTPCKTLEEAEAIVKKAVIAHLANSSAQYRSSSWIDAADNLAIAVPHAYRKELAEKRLHDLTNSHNANYARNQVISYQKQVDDIAAEITKLQEFLSPQVPA
jgi:hypothetical protein